MEQSRKVKLSVGVISLGNFAVPFKSINLPTTYKKLQYKEMRIISVQRLASSFGTLLQTERHPVAFI